jgi:hypothetical protein
VRVMVFVEGRHPLGHNLGHNSEGQPPVGFLQGRLSTSSLVGLAPYAVSRDRPALSPVQLRPRQSLRFNCALARTYHDVLVVARFEPARFVVQTFLGLPESDPKPKLRAEFRDGRNSDLSFACPRSGHSSHVRSSPVCVATCPKRRPKSLCRNRCTAVLDESSGATPHG